MNVVYPRNESNNVSDNWVGYWVANTRINPNERPCSLRFFNTSSDPFASRLSSSQTSIVCLPSVNQSLQCANTVFQNRYMSHEPRILSMSSGSE